MGVEVVNVGGKFIELRHYSSQRGMIQSSLKWDFALPRIDIHHQERKTLADVVVEFTRDPLPLHLLTLNEARGQLPEFGIQFV